MSRPMITMTTTSVAKMFWCVILFLVLHVYKNSYYPFFSLVCTIYTLFTLLTLWFLVHDDNNNDHADAM